MVWAVWAVWGGRALKVLSELGESAVVWGLRMFSPRDFFFDFWFICPDLAISGCFGTVFGLGFAGEAKRKADTFRVPWCGFLICLRSSVPRNEGNSCV